MKVCRTCGRELPEQMFYSRLGRLDPSCKECFSAAVQERKKRRLERDYKSLPKSDVLAVERDGIRLWVDLAPENPWYTQAKSHKPALMYRDEQEGVEMRLATFRNVKAARGFLPILALMFPELLDGVLPDVASEGEGDGS